MANKIEGNDQKSFFSRQEEDVLKFWEERDIFRKSVEQRAEAKEFVFFEGPPTANGRPGLHHVLARSFKDVICRYKTMQGFKVERKAGWDTHGLPVELQVEKELGIRSKPEIESYGIEKFNKKCRESVWHYKDEWEKMTKRMAYWLDLEHPYITYSNEYIESVWWILSEIHSQGLLYEGYKVVPYCVRCGTGLSSHEVAQGYKKIKDNSIYVRFKIKNRLGTGLVIINDNAEILLGKRIKTGDWTLPGGKVETGETFEQTIVREAKEETGLDIEIIKTLGFAESASDGSHWRYQNFVGRIKGGELQDEKGKIEGWRWFSPDKLPPNIYEPSRKTLKLFVAAGENKESDVSVQEKESTYFLVWTTTSWTLPGNVALAVNPDLVYVKAKIEDPETKTAEYLILAKDRVPAVVAGEFKIVEEYKGKDLVGLGYEQLFDFLKPEKPAYKAVTGDFVTAQDGSGVVHIAPAFGEDDMRVAQENDLPVLLAVDKEGKFVGEIAAWPGRSVVDKAVGEEIIRDLEKRRLLFKMETVEHDYPFCWRCDTKLIYYAKKSWFIKMTDGKIKAALVKNNAKINWVPEYIKEGRFGEWLRDVKDWALSRERYWGTPLPIWRCHNCGNLKIVGSCQELKELSGKTPDDLHRPYIDEVFFKCSRCGADMKRVPDVIDVWFDSGSMPFAQWHYPFENKEVIDKKKKFPADYISEAIDQTRGWFYTLLAISTLLGKGPAYKNVITYGHILDVRGQKMSKSRGNVVDPWSVADAYGLDILRWFFYTVGAPGEPKKFDFKDLEEIRNKFFRTYWNSFLFFKTYALKNSERRKSESGKRSLLDSWIVSRLHETILKATGNLEAYDVIRAARAIDDFVDDLSNWYIRRSRDRMRKQDAEALENLHLVLNELAKITAPFIPFISESIYRGLEADEAAPRVESVHLVDWPKANERLVNDKLNQEMKLVRQAVNLGLAMRSKSGIKVRQPLAELVIKNQELKVSEELLDLIKDELNVKKVSFAGELAVGENWLSASDVNLAVALDVRLTDELREEGIARELIRQIQALRKAAKYTIKDPAAMHYYTEDPLTRKVIDARQEAIRQKTILSLIEFKPQAESGDHDIFKKINLGAARIDIGLKKQV